MAIKFESFRGTGGGAVTGGLVYKGSYDAATNSPVLTSAKKGDFYIVSVAGTLAGVTLNVGDHIVFNQDASSPITSAMFDVIDNTDAVASVNGQTGVVSLGASDVNALAIASNLSDLNNAGTARTNLGLGTSATLDTGTSNGNVVVLDATGLPAVDGSQLTGITATDNTKLAIANNLSDLNNATTARTNLGLGTSATLDTGTSNGNVVVLDATGLPAVDGSQLTNVTGTDSTKLAIANNLSDLNNVATARTNLGLGTSATLDTGTSNGNVVVLDATGLPAVDGSQLTGVTGTDSTKLAIASNLSDLNNVSTARTNLGLGTSATLDTGTSNGNVVVLDATGLPAVDGSQLTGVTSTDNTKLAIANNLSDLNNATTARTNLGLGTSSTLDVGTGANNVVQLDGTSKLPAVDGSQLTNISPTGALLITNNLSDLNSASTARTNLGLGTSATLDTGTSNGNVVVLDATGLPAVDGSQLTGVTGTDNTKLAIASNLSDLNNVATARTNLGLGTSSTLDVGTSANNVVQLDGSSRLPAVDGSQLTNLPSGAGETLQQVTDNGATTTTNISVAQVTMGGDLLADGDQTHTIGSETNRFVTTHGDLNGAVRFKAKANVALSKGDVVYIAGVSGGVPTVEKAQANSASTMPAFGVCYAAASLNAEVQIVTFGNLEGINTGSFAVGDTLFVSETTAGALANSAPAGESNLIQNIGRVVKVDGTGNSGIYKIGGAGRTNATPNLDSNKIFLGNGSNQAVSTALSAINLSSFNDDLAINIVDDTTPQLGGDLDVNGQDIVSVSNGAIELAPDGTGKVTIKGNATGGSGQIVLNCEQNSHGITLKGPPHSAAASYTLTFPNTDGTADQVLKTDGSGNLDWVDQASGGGGFTYTAITSASSPVTGAASTYYSADTSGGAITINLPALSGVTAGTEIRVKLKTAGNNLILSPDGTEQVDLGGAGTDYTLTVQNQAVTLVSDGSSNWEVI